MKTAKKLYQQGILKFRHGDFNSGIKDFISSSLDGYKPAIKELGICYLHGIGTKQDILKAVKNFKKAKTNAETQFELSKLYYFGFGVKKDLSKSQKYLIKSVKQNYTPAINLMAMAFQISNKFKKSNKLFFLASQLNDNFAMHLNSLKLINKPSGNLNFINKFNWKLKTTHLPKDILHIKPQIFQIHNLLTSIECEYIKISSSPFMRESMTIDPETGEHIKDEMRTSFSASIDWLAEDPALNLIISKCCTKFDTHENQSEVMHVLHYSVGEEYKAHYDFFGGTSGLQNFQKNEQRIKTMCLYLNDVEQGGETSFPRLNKTVSPEKGKVVFFENFDLQNNQPYLESLHAGLPILSGEKWLATLWIRPSSSNRGPNYESI